MLCPEAWTKEPGTWKKDGAPGDKLEVGGWGEGQRYAGAKGI